tara:strand:+ start:6453 stop:7523 length:1071 start_codon:yes stop_codon:yes gene_type:complete
MQSWVFKVFRFIHAWGGITIALLLLLSSITGSLLVWKNEYVLLSFPDAQREFSATPEFYAELASRVEEQFNNNEIAQLTFPTADFPLAKVALSDARYAYLDLDGNILDQWVQNDRFEEWLYDLHHRLLLDDLGLTIVGLMGMAMSILVLAGIISFLPFRRSFRQGFWPKGTSRTTLLVSHRNIGIIEALPLLMTLVTGAVLAFPEQGERYLLEPFRGDEYSMDFSDNIDGLSGDNSGDWLPVIQRSLDSFPGASVRSAELPNDFSPYRIIGMQQAGELHPEGLSKIYIEAEGGWMDLRIDAQNQHVSERLYNTAYPLHTGKFDNLFYKLLLTLSGLLVSTLSVVGIFSFFKKYKWC